MVDPVTIGTLAANVLAMGAETALKAGVGEAVKDAYKALKARLSRHAPEEVDALEAAPTSKGKQMAVAERIDETDQVDETELRQLVRLLTDAIEAAAKAQPIGIDIGRLEAARVHLGPIEVTAGIGGRFGDIKSQGDFVVEALKVGHKP